jgi:solute carrier family 25 (mitochondrial iron transporter), member 28/37
MSELPEFEELEQDWDPNKLSFVDHMLAGSFAGLAEHVAMFPLDTLKTNVQCEKCGSNSPLKTVNCAKRIVKQDGILRLWRGVSTMFIGCIPGKSLLFPRPRLITCFSLSISTCSIFQYL